MTTISVPVPPKLEALLDELVKKGYGANKADVFRKALSLVAEEEAVFSVLRAEQEVKEGKVLRGDLATLTKKFS